MTADEVTVRDLLERDVAEIHRALKALAEDSRESRETSSREHAEVREELRELRAKVDGAVTSNEFREYRGRMYDRLEPLEDDHQQRQGASRARGQLWRLVVSGSAVAGVVGGAMIAVIRTFVFPA